MVKGISVKSTGVIYLCAISRNIWANLTFSLAFNLFDAVTQFISARIESRSPNFETNFSLR